MELTVGFLFLFLIHHIIANDSHFDNGLTYRPERHAQKRMWTESAWSARHCFPAALTTITIFPDRKEDSSPPPWSYRYGEYQRIVPAPP